MGKKEDDGFLKEVSDYVKNDEDDEYFGIKNFVIVIVSFILIMLAVLFLFKGNKEITTSDYEQVIIYSNNETSSTTTTTLLETNVIENIDMNFITPNLRSNDRHFITNNFNVYINDSFLKIVYKNNSNDRYNDNINAVKKAFSLWENKTDLVHFNFVDSSEDHTIYVEWDNDMSTTMGGTHTIAYAQALGYACDGYFFITGGEITLSTRGGESQLAITAHEIGHILNLADVGNKGSLMGGWYDSYDTPNEEDLREMFTEDINETLMLTIHPEYECPHGEAQCMDGGYSYKNECYYTYPFPCDKNSIYCNKQCWEYCPDGYTFNCQETYEMCEPTPESFEDGIQCGESRWEKCITDLFSSYCYPFDSVWNGCKGVKVY